MLHSRTNINYYITTTLTTLLKICTPKGADNQLMISPYRTPLGRALEEVLPLKREVALNAPGGAQ